MKWEVYRKATVGDTTSDICWRFSDVTEFPVADDEQHQYQIPVTLQYNVSVL